MSSPFDDPEVAAAMRKAGIVHRPGMADEMMSQIAPLLAEDGINLDAFEGDLDQLNAAMARATERYNLSLFTPTGVHRAGALAVLRVFAQARADGDLDSAEHVLDSVQPEPTETYPAVSHVIGVGLGLLDEWSRAADVKRIIATAKPRPWNLAAGKASRRILEGAKRGRAFAALDELIISFGGLAVFQGVAVAVAEVIRVFAARKKLSIYDACEVLLPGAADPDDFAIPGASLPVDVVTVEKFGEWLGEVEEEAETVEMYKETLASIFGFARVNGLDPQDPNSIEDLLGFLAASAEDTDVDDREAALDWLYDVVDEYIHFQLDLDDDPDGWEAAHSVVEAYLPLGDNALLVLMDRLREGEAGDVGVRQAAVTQLPIVSAVPALLNWIGNGRPGSSTGAVKRADIREVAALLGIDAVGVSRRPPLGPPSQEGTRSVLAMHELPELAAWWEALRIAEVLETTTTRILPGAQAGAWLSDEGASLESMEQLTAIFLTVLARHDAVGRRNETLRRWETQSALGMMERLIQAIADEVMPEEADRSEPTQLFPLRVDGDLARLEGMGLVRIARGNRVTVPVGLQLTVLRGVMVASSLLNFGRE